jgi:predicted negative regulator of RcsB-dependent stress response
MTPNSSEPRIVEQFDMEIFWAKHGQKVMVGALVVLALGGGAFLWQRQQASKAEAAATRLATAQDARMLEAVAQEYAGTETGAQALLRLASAHFRAGRHDDAARVYQQFQAQHPRHPFAPTAALGLAAVREAKGDTAGAKDLYLTMAGGQVENYVRIAARLGAARCAELLGQKKEAKQLYEETLAAAQGTPWEAEAYMRWVVLARELPAEPAVAAPPVAATPAIVFPQP